MEDLCKLCVFGCKLCPSILKILRDAWMNSHQLVEELKQYVIRLTEQRDMIRYEIEYIKSGRDESYFDSDSNRRINIHANVMNWLLKADDVLEGARRFLDHEKDMSRLNRSLRTGRMIERIKQLLDRINSIEFVPRTPTSTFHHSHSFDSAFERIVAALETDGVSMIALWGMAGVGKTTLVKRVVKEISSFSKYIVMPVSQTPNIEKIQNRIAAILDLEIEGTEMGSRAKQLRHGLKKENKLLIILDDVWEGLNLKAIGIPHHKGCKIILTTRHLQVCNSMGVQEVISLDFLSHDDAMGFLGKRTGTSIDYQANKLLKELCQGLPLAIVNLGGHQYLQSTISEETDKATEEWCEELERPKFRNGECLEVLKPTCLAIRSSYDSLSKSTTKRCFLLCSLLPLDSAIDVEVLTRYAWGVQLYAGIHSVNKVRCKVKMEITTLIDCSLFLHHEREGVKMHKLVRYCALWIASQEKVPLSGDEIFTLRDRHLTAGSLQALNNPRSLLLVRCQLDDISSLGKLQKLEILSFQGSDISELPDEIAELNHLRLLDLWDCQKLQKLPLILLRKLSQLEELFFNFLSLEEWWLEETGKKGSTASSSEIHPSSSLSNKLRTHNIAIDIDASYEYPKSRILKVTAFSSNIEFFPADECLHLLSADNHCDERMQQLSNSTCMDLIEFPNLRCIWNGPPRHVNLQNLKVLILKDCNKLISLFSISTAESLVYLEKLEINGCEELEQIITEVLYDDYADLSFSYSTYPQCLRSLEMLEIKKCGKLKYVLRIDPINTVPIAPLLSELKISDCSELTRLFDVHNDFSVLRDLKQLSLQRLDALTTFCSEGFSIGLPSLETLGVRACPLLITNDISEIIKRDQLKEISFNTVGRELYEEIFQLQVGYFLSSLEKMVLEELLELKVIWKDPNQIISLQNLACLKLIKCIRLKHVFSVQIARNLPQLNHLEVVECEEMEQVISKDQKASSMASRKPEYFPNLEVICIKKCNNLKYLFPLTVSRLPKLKKLQVEEACNLVQIFEHQVEENIKNDEQEVKLPALEELSLQKLPNLLAFCSVGYCFVFPSLRSLEVTQCPRRIMDFLHDWGHCHVRTKIEIGNRDSYFRKKIGEGIDEDIRVNQDIRVKYEQTSNRYKCYEVSNQELSNKLSSE